MLENISFSFWLYFWRDFVHLHARRRFPAFQTFKLASNKLIEIIKTVIIKKWKRSAWHEWSRRHHFSCVFGVNMSIYPECNAWRHFFLLSWITLCSRRLISPFDWLLIGF